VDRSVEPMGKLYLQAGHGRVMPWGAHPYRVWKRRAGSKDVIGVGDELFDALERQKITEPKGRDQRLSLAQFRSLIEWMPEAEASRIKVSLTAAGISPIGME
jgi:hypothetical protein